MKKEITNSSLTEAVTNLPSIQNEALLDTIKGIYADKPLLGQNGLLTNSIKDLTQISLQGEMDSHLQNSSLKQGSNPINGIATKTMKTAS